ncbi:MAG: HRDC domain-containing protein [Methylococcaceae bacterium]|nr:HRDC domain-containing protein [Methylococcaceae bacterium]
MKFRFFRIPVIAPEHAEDALNKFCAQNPIASIEKQFVADGEKSFWSICVTGLENEPAARNTKKDKIDYREVLDEKQFAVFARLRTLRKGLAEREGVPAYALFTNEQLAEMVRQQIASLAGMAAIEGVGKARIDKYGEAFLRALKQGLENDLSEYRHEAEPD